MDDNIINKLGPLAVGARIRRFYDQLARDMARIYKENGLPLEPKDFILYYLLAESRQLSISDIARELSLTHPAVIHLAKSLEKMGYVKSEKDPEDGRKRYLTLTRKGHQDLEKYQPLWDKVRAVNHQLFEAESSLLETIAGLERKLEERSFYQRIILLPAGLPSSGKNTRKRVKHK